VFEGAERGISSQSPHKLLSNAGRVALHRGIREKRMQSPGCECGG
jgi:hypothetical protein